MSDERGYDLNEVDRMLKASPDGFTAWWNLAREVVDAAPAMIRDLKRYREALEDIEREATGSIYCISQRELAGNIAHIASEAIKIIGVDHAG